MAGHLRLVTSEPEPDSPVETLMQRVLSAVREQFGDLLDGPQGDELRARIWEAVVSDSIAEETDSQQKR
jgi:hypothetical protein